jgi:hypothetical protein
MKSNTIVCLVVFAAVYAGRLLALPMGTAFTYQGVGTDNGRPATGLYDVECALFDAPLDGIQIGPTQDFPGSYTDSNGVFTVVLNFGSTAFNGQARWLEWRVRTNGSTNAHTILTPRQQLTPVPAAIYATQADNVFGNVATTQITGNFPTARLSGLLPSDLLSGTYSNAVTLNNAGNSFGGNFSGNGGGLANVNADLLDGYHSSSFVLLGSSPYFSDLVATRLNIGSGHSLSGSYATIPGGYQNQASGDYSFAAGYRAKASHRGAFVWADNAAGDFASTAANQFLIRASGGVGINTNKPQAILDVLGATSFGSAVIRGVATNTGGPAILGLSTNVFGIPLGVAIQGMAYGRDSVGVVGYGEGYDFDAQGPGINYGSTSSIRWKRNVTQIDEPLAKLTALRGVYFNWDAEHGGGHDVGMIAEEVGKVLPEIVGYEPNGIDARSMDYSKLTPLLVEASKALKMQVDELRRQLSEKDTRISALETDLAGVKASLNLLREQKQGAAK